LQGAIAFLTVVMALQILMSVLFTVFVSSVVGSVVGISVAALQRSNLRVEVPYGPFLALAAIIYLFYQIEIRELLVAFYLPPQP